MAVFNNQLAGAAGQGGAGPYQIERSLRFNDDDSSFLSRNFSTEGNRKTWTWSGWLKQSGTTTQWIPLFEAYDGSSTATHDFLQIAFYGNKIGVANNTVWFVQSQAVYRDYSAWMHVVVSFNTTESVANDRVKVYINGERLEDFTTATPPSLNTNYGANRAITHRIGNRYQNNYLDGYLADVHFIDGQALTADDFGEPDANGVWQPKAFAGTYGTNGFHLDFSDASSNSALGDDSSGNNNDWTVNNLVATVDPLYSSFATYPSSYNGSAINLFDGSTSTGWQNTDTSGSTYAEVDLTLGGTTSGIAFTTSFEMYGAFSYNQVLEIDHAGGTYTYTSNPGGSGAWVNFASNLTSPVTEIRFKDSGGTGTPSWNAIRVDGSILTDGDQSAIDSLIDTPTNYEASSGNNGGNYATLNPLANSGLTLSNGNLDFTSSGANRDTCIATQGVSSGKWYWEVTVGDDAIGVGIEPQGYIPVSDSRTGNESAGYSWWLDRQQTYHNNGTSTSYGASVSSGDVIGVALDLDGGTLTFYKNNSSQGTAFTGISGTYLPAISDVSNALSMSGSINFGARPFAYTPPTGHLPLVTTSLTDPTIADGSTAMDVALWTGNGSTQSISGLSMSPDLVWVKQRNTSRNHQLVDTVRGATKDLRSNTTAAESTTSTGLTAFTSDGFTLGGDAGYNQSSGTYVGWTWDAGTTTATNTDGSITSNVRANQSAGFSIVSYTGNGVNGASVGHGLNAAPEFVIQKDRDATTNWQIFHAGAQTSGALQMTFTSSTPTSNATVWSNTAPTNSVIYLGSGDTNTSGNDQIIYAFAPVNQYSSFGVYTGTASSSQGPFVFTGFRPRWILVKSIDAAGGWRIHDTARETYNPHDTLLFASGSNADTSDSNYRVDILSNGFRIRASGGAFNASGERYVYAAFAEHPFSLNGGLAR